MGDAAGSIGHAGLETITGGWEVALGGIAFDEGDETLVVESLVFGTEAGSGDGVLEHALAKASIEKNGAGVVGLAADDAEVLLEGNIGFEGAHGRRPVVRAGLPARESHAAVERSGARPGFGGRKRSGP
jgi:hypothetical protein